MIKDILLLGNPQLYEISEAVEINELDAIKEVIRYKKTIIKYRDIKWNDCEMEFTGDLSELVQHEYDHLDGILATMRALDNKSFFLKG